MLLKDFVEILAELLKNNPEYGELEVWTYSDEESNSILPMYEDYSTAFVKKDLHKEVDEYIKSYHLQDHLDYYGISLDEFKDTHKEIILI